jgi:4-diphosphocytidyl-2C-methyl-D-erythritol kinase
MDKIFTSDDLIRYAYNEMTEAESAEFHSELIECEHLQQELLQIIETKNRMEESVMSAPPEVIKSLLNYSSSLQIVNSVSTGGSFGIVLN